MGRIGTSTREKLKEQLLRVLYDSYPGKMWTFQISEELLRDNEFVLQLLLELHQKKLVSCNEESSGGNVKRRWGLPQEVHRQYKNLLE